MGVAVGDYDNDGYEDLYVTAYGGNKLYHNNGNGTFTDVTAESGVAEHSQHMESRAIDLRVPGISTARLRDAALSLDAGGVGYYPVSRFVHVDVGPVRTWSFGGARTARLHRGAHRRTRGKDRADPRDDERRGVPLRVGHPPAVRAGRRVRGVGHSKVAIG